MSVAAQRARWVQKTHAARLATVVAMSPYDGVAFSLTALSNRAFEAAERQWSSVYYDWPQINRKINDPDRLDLALWVQDRLVALCMASTRERAVFVNVVEGDPDQDCPLAGARLEILPYACASYAQIRGKSELRLQPKNDDLIRLYETVYEFERVTVVGGDPYWRRKV